MGESLTYRLYTLHIIYTKATHVPDSHANMYRWYQSRTKTHVATRVYVLSNGS